MTYCLTNYTIQCRDADSGEIGCFLFDIERWKQTGRFFAVSPVYANLDEFFDRHREDTRGQYIERTA